MADSSRDSYYGSGHDRDRHTRERHKRSPSPRRRDEKRRRHREFSPEEKRQRRRSRSPPPRRHDKGRRHSSEEEHSRHSSHHGRGHHTHTKTESGDRRPERGRRVRQATEDEERGRVRSHGDGILGSPPREMTSRRHHGDEKRHNSRWGKAEEEEEKVDVSQYQFGGSMAESSSAHGDSGGEEEEDKLKPNYGLSGKLTAETNTYKGEVIKYNEPPEARQPKTRWRFYQFKGDELINVLYIHRQSAFLIGRERKIVDFPVDHPSCSKQHAVLQYRLADYVKDDGSKGRRVRPYIIDLDSTNGTYLNNNRIEPSRYYELKEKDMIKFGFSSREYVLLHENSRVSEDEDD